MKLITTTLFAIALTSVSALANDNNNAKKEASAKPAKVVTVKAPFENHWDANSWENGSGDNFWNAKAPAKNTAKPKATK